MNRSDDIDNLISRCEEFEAAIIWTTECLCCLQAPKMVTPIILMLPFEYDTRKYSGVCIFSCTDCADLKNKSKFYENLTRYIKDGNVEVMN